MGRFPARAFPLMGREFMMGHCDQLSALIVFRLTPPPWGRMGWRVAEKGTGAPIVASELMPAAYPVLTQTLMTISRRGEDGVGLLTAIYKDRRSCNFHSKGDERRSHAGRAQ